MSGFITTTGENFLLELICRGVQPPETLWLALIANNEPTKFSTGAEIDEPDVTEYARIPYLNQSGNWSERAGQMSNTITVETPPISGNVVWPTIRHWGLLDAEFGGNLLWAGTLDAPITPREGDVIEMPPGTIIIRTASYMSRVSAI